MLESLKTMREANDPADIDAENFYRLVLIVRAIAVSRPHNLAKFAEQYANNSIDESTGTRCVFLNLRIKKKKRNM